MPRRKTIYDKSYRLLIDRLRAAREAAGITQTLLAKRLGTDQSYVSKYERSERRLDAIELREVCRALGLDFAGFIADFELELRHWGL